MDWITEVMNKSVDRYNTFVYTPFLQIRSWNFWFAFWKENASIISSPVRFTARNFLTHYFRSL